MLLACTHDLLSFSQQYCPSPSSRYEHRSSLWQRAAGRWMKPQKATSADHFCTPDARSCPESPLDRAQGPPSRHPLPLLVSAGDVAGQGMCVPAAPCALPPTSACWDALGRDLALGVVDAPRPSSCLPREWMCAKESEL